MNKFLASSVDPTKLSLTVKGILVSAIPFIIWFAKVNGVELPETEIGELVTHIADAVELVGRAVGAIMIIYGLVRKILVYFGFPKS